MRAHVICLVDIASDTNWSSRFPASFRLAPHRDTCHDW
jgi:hypothetical protein